jgi:AMP-activated protein kinase-like protein
MAEDTDDTQDLNATEQRFIAQLRAPVVADADAFDARVMAAVQREGAFGRSSRRGRHRMVAAISVAGVALAAVIAFMMIGSGANDTVRKQQPVSIAHSALSTVRFTLVASGASQVAVAGSFNGWNAAATPLRRIDKNTWAADIPLGAGRYVYQFVIDGHRWVPDPQAPRDPGDDFGATNSVVTVAGSGSA